MVLGFVVLGFVVLGFVTAGFGAAGFAALDFAVVDSVGDFTTLDFADARFLGAALGAFSTGVSDCFGGAGTGAATTSGVATLAGVSTAAGARISAVDFSGTVTAWGCGVAGVAGRGISGCAAAALRAEIARSMALTALTNRKAIAAPSRARRSTSALSAIIRRASNPVSQRAASARFSASLLGSDGRPSVSFESGPVSPCPLSVNALRKLTQPSGMTTSVRIVATRPPIISEIAMP